MKITIVDLTLYAASICQHCRSHGRPIDETDQEHGNSFVHDNGANSIRKNDCKADQIWGLIRKLESR